METIRISIQLHQFLPFIPQEGALYKNGWPFNVWNTSALVSWIQKQNGFGPS